MGRGMGFHFQLTMIVISTSLVFSTEVSNAQSSALRGGSSSSTSTGSISNAPSSAGPNASTATTVVTPQTGGYGSSGNMNASAKNSKSQAMMGAAMNGATAAYWFSQCSKKNWPACAFGAMHVAQAGMMLKGAGGAGKTQDATMYGIGMDLDEGTYGSDFGGGGASDESSRIGLGMDIDPLNQLNQQFAAEQKRINDLSGRFGALGYKVSQDGRSLTLPNGKSVPTSAFTSKGGLASLGLSVQQIEEHERLKAEWAAKMQEKVKALAVEEGGGGANGSRSRVRGMTDDREGGLNFGSLLGQNNGRKTASVKGLSKQLGSDRIGVQADNIFEMISRQYQKEEGKQSFIPAAGAVTPAAGR